MAVKYSTRINNPMHASCTYRPMQSYIHGFLQATSPTPAHTVPVRCTAPGRGLGEGVGDVLLQVLGEHLHLKGVAREVVHELGKKNQSIKMNIVRRKI